jgi:hypothetical protein
MRYARNWGRLWKMENNECDICWRIPGMRRDILFDLALCNLLSNLVLRRRLSPEINGNLKKKNIIMKLISYNREALLDGHEVHSYLPERFYLIGHKGGQTEYLQLKQKQNLT